MKTIACSSLLLLVMACASPTAVIDKRALRCEAGQDISIDFGYDDGTRSDSDNPNQPTYLVQISNNSHSEVTVKAISVEPAEGNLIHLDSAYLGPDLAIPENEDHLFRLPTRKGFEPSASASRPRSSGQLTFSVRVTLSNGDSYRCPFRFGM